MISTRAHSDLIERVLLTAFLTMFPTGAGALLLAQLWAPLVYLFWPGWVVVTALTMSKVHLRIRRCQQCGTRARHGATRCRACTQPLA